MEYNDIRERLKQNGLQMNFVAKELNYTENGLKNALIEGTFRMSGVKKLCEMMKMSPNEFLGYSKDLVSVNKGIIAKDNSTATYNNYTDRYSDKVLKLTETITKRDETITELYKLLAQKANLDKNRN